MSTYHGRPTGYRGDHRSKTDQAGRWFPLVIYGAGILAIVALLSGWWV